MFISVHTEHASNFKDYKMKHPILNSYLSKQSKVKKRLYLRDVFSYHHTRKMTRHMYLRIEMSRDKKFLKWISIYIIYVIICYSISYPIYEKYLNTIFTSLSYRNRIRTILNLEETDPYYPTSRQIAERSSYVDTTALSTRYCIAPSSTAINNRDLN